MNSEYWLGRDEVTWDEAKLNCMTEDAKLVEIGSYAEDIFVRTLAKKLTKTVWLGGTDVGTEGRWVWQSDRSPFTYSAWNIAKGQPNNYNNQDCLSLYRPYNLTWCDEKCVTRYQYICEKENFQDYVDDKIVCSSKIVFVKDCTKKIPTLCCGFLFLSAGYAFNIDMKIKNDDQTIGGLTKETLT